MGTAAVTTMTAQPPVVEMKAILEICALLLWADDLLLREHKATCALTPSVQGKRSGMAPEYKAKEDVQSLPKTGTGPGRKRISFKETWRLSHQA